MSNIFDESIDKGIIKDERFLYPEYVPERLPFREEEITEMVFCLKPATSGNKPENIFISGPPGIGKTVTSKFVLSELSEYSDRTKCLYINCFQLTSYNEILAKATNFLGYPVPMRGLSNVEIFERFVAIIKNKKTVPIIVFDEAEQLLKKDDTKKLLYDLSRLNDSFNIFIGLIFISNDKNFLFFLDDRIKSSLNVNTIIFEKYSCQELKEILRERAKFTFFPNVLDDDVIPLCAAHYSKNGDARKAISTLLKSARIAEKENSKKVLIKHVRQAIQDDSFVKFEIIDNLSSQEKLILDFLSDKELTTIEIYSSLKNSFAERTLRKAISDLEEKGIIEIKKETNSKGILRTIKRK